MVSLLDPNQDDIIFDPACGSGGFLIMTIRKVKDRIVRDFPNLPKSDLHAQLKSFAENNVFGCDINDRMVRVAKMNMIMHGDGHAGIFQTNGLLTDEDVPERVVSQIGKYTLLFSNPPFAGREKDPTVLTKFALGKNKEDDVVQVSKEVLFIELLLKAAAPKARIGLMIPSGVFNNKSMSSLREYIFRNSRILAIVGLPRPAFRVSGANNQGNLIFLQKMTNPPDDYEIFIDWASAVGFDSTGKKIPRNDLTDILRRWKNPKKENIIRFSELNKVRIDPWYYHSRYYEMEKALSKANHPLESIGNLVEQQHRNFNRDKVETNSVFEYAEVSDLDLEEGKIATTTPFTGRSIPSRASHVLHEGDFLIPNALYSMRGVAVVDKEHEGVIGSSRFFVVRPKPDRILPQYLYHTLRDPLVMCLLKRQATGEVNPGINYEELYRVSIPVPDLQKQRDLVHRIERLESRRKDLFTEAQKIEAAMRLAVSGYVPSSGISRARLGTDDYEYIASM
jgi:type I restriction enzyme M protein